jgi:uncharacterized SAM-binding protein YcdF (DUF218 family)
MARILGSLILPSQVGFLLAAAGLLLLMSRRTRRAAVFMLVASVLVLAVFSTGKMATLVMSPLEFSFPRVPDELPPAQAIVVLAAYAADDPDMSLSDRPNPSGLYRIVEGVLLWRKCEDCRVVVTGGSPTTDVMAALVIALGVPRDRVTIDTGAVNTAASAANVQRLLGTAPFFLVTSAGHLPRAMQAFTARGLQPIPAPTDHQLPRTVRQASWSLSPFHLQASDLAMHEWAGGLWYRLRRGE